ncbi:hypothetical protein AAH994_06300 [Weeksellaceae bacterium A-14]|uniref:hypothetical protein n=1 Tax=Daejeonia sp. YH14 TaxID=3439042 RepID=UPI0031E4A71A
MPAKSGIYQFVRNRVLEKIQMLENLIAETRASNNDTKSSMGDKYETGREMLQQQINQLQLQLKEVIQKQQFLETLKLHDTVKSEPGALVQTDKGWFYISVSLGEIRPEGTKIICISPEAPLAHAMKGKTAGENFAVNGNIFRILDIL